MAETILIPPGEWQVIRIDEYKRLTTEYRGGIDSWLELWDAFDCSPQFAALKDAIHKEMNSFESIEIAEIRKKSGRVSGNQT